MRSHKLKTGFSLIELLVVVAIIGILAAVGITGYQIYIDSTRDSVTGDSQRFIERAIDVDVIALRSDLSARSDFAQGFDTNSWCSDYRDRIINQVNVANEKTNPFNNNGLLCDGNGLIDDIGSTAKDNISIPRGNIMVACQNPVAAVSEANFGFYTCACSGLDECFTEPRPWGNLTAAITPATNVIIFLLSTTSKENVMDAVASNGQLSIDVGGGVKQAVSFSVCNKVTGTSPIEYRCALSTGQTSPTAAANAEVTIVGESNTFCWTPDPFTNTNAAMFNACQ